MHIKYHRQEIQTTGTWNYVAYIKHVDMLKHKYTQLHLRRWITHLAGLNKCTSLLINNWNNSQDWFEIKIRYSIILEHVAELLCLANIIMKSSLLSVLYLAMKRPCPLINAQCPCLTCIIVRGNCTPSQNWAYFVCCLKIMNTFFWKNDMSILKQTILETQKWHSNFSRPSNSWVLDQNSILHASIKEPR